jgi:AraC-like DNA-binding protein
MPMSELARHAASVWWLRVAADAPVYEHRTVPNGAVEISYAIGADTAVISGPQRHATLDSLRPGSTIVGIRFRPGLAQSILGVPVAELVDRRVDADTLWGLRLVEELGATATPEAAARVLELEVLRRSAEPSDGDPLVRAAIRRLQPWCSDRVDASATGLFISPRHLRRRFVAALGFGPKRLQRILRFQGFLALSQLRQGEHVTLARLATVAGYADQAHLTRECSELTGLTPRAFLEETWKSCGPNHDHEVSYGGLRRALLQARMA